MRFLKAVFVNFPGNWNMKWSNIYVYQMRLKAEFEMKSLQISEDKKIMMNEKQSQGCEVNKIL